MTVIARCLTVTSVLVLTACQPLDTEGGLEDEPVAHGDSEIAGGTDEPDYLHPWVVSLNSFNCRGVLIAPGWVLTAAHCVAGGVSDVTYRRIDPQTGTLHTDSSGTVPEWTFINPEYDPDETLSPHDIALIALTHPFQPDQFIQTAALPSSAPFGGQIGTIASNPQRGDGQIRILRTPIKFTGLLEFFIESRTASLCPGDSGGGFVTMVDGRATVAGLVKSGTINPNCNLLVNSIGAMTDVFAHREWILQTMRLEAVQVDGLFRLRWTGRASDGTLSLECHRSWPRGSPRVEGPMNVMGVQIGLSCPPDTQEVRVKCTLNNSTSLSIKSFTEVVKTLSGTVIDTNALDHGSSSASATRGPISPTIHEFACGVGRRIVIQP